MMSKENLASVSVLSNPPSRLEQSPYYVPTAFAVMLIGLIVLFGNFLFSGKMLYGSDMISAGICHRSLLVEHFNESEEIPQWNPYVYGGMPYVDAFHGDIFYPFGVLKFFIPLYFHLGFNLILHIFFAGVFMYLAARQFKLGKTAALFSAACYMFAPCLVSLVAAGHDGKIYTSALFPLVVLFLDRAFETRPFLNFTILGMILGIIILSPQPDSSYFTFWVVGLFALFKLIVLWRQAKLFRAIIRPGLLVVYAVIVALLLSAIQFYPGYTYSTESSVRVGREGSWIWATSWSMHEEEAFSQLIPEFCGTSFPHLSQLETETYQSTYWGKNYFKADSDSVGVAAIFLSLSCFLFARRKETYFFAALALFAFIYALGATTPLFEIFYFLIPKVSLLRAPSKIIFIFSFSISLLAGMGVQSIIGKGESKEFRMSRWVKFYLLSLPAFLLIVAVLFNFAGKEMLSVWMSLFFPEASISGADEGLTRFVMAIQHVPEIKHGAWMAFLAVAFSAIIIWLYLKRKVFTAIISLLILVPLIDGVRFNSRFVEVTDPKEHFKPTALVNFLKSQEGEFRVLNLSRSIPRSLLPQHGIELVTGYHGNQLRWYDDLLGRPDFANDTNPRFLNLVGCRYIIIRASTRFEEDFFGKTPAGPVAFFDWDQVIRNDNAFERVFLVNKYRIFNDRRQIPQAIVEGTEDLRQIVYLEELPDIPILSDNLAQDSAWIISRGLDSVVIGVHCISNCLLVLMDNYYDSWHAAADGNPLEILRAYGSFRAVAIAAGTKEVKFTYYSNRYEIGKAITTVTSAYLLIIFGFYLWKSYSGKRVREAK